MGKRDPRIDAYIEKSAEFAKPILRHIRDVVHAAAPEAEETVKWGMPHFDYKGVLCNMAAFKEHCAMGFWKGSLIEGAERTSDAMGHLGRITSMKDLPPKKELTRMVKEAVRLNEEGVKTPERSKPKAPKPPLETPDDLAAALKKNKKAKANFDAFPPSHRREYIEWINEAKTDATREKRLAQTLAWLEEGKSRNWKYERK